MTLVGKSILRTEDDRLLRGRGQYIDDLSAEGMLHACVVRSSVAHGLIKEIDTSAALDMPGVVAVYTFADIAPYAKPIKPRLASLAKFELFLQLPMANGKVRYVGEPVALVVAETPHLAEDAASAVMVDIEDLPVVADWETASAGDTLIHETAGTNCSITNVSRGDPDAAFASAAYTRKERFSIQRHTAVPMETRGLLAVWREETSRLEVRGVTKIPHFNRTLLAGMLDMPESSIDMILSDVGGGFGVRGEFYPEDLLIPLAAWKLNRPVKWIEDRREHLMATNHAREMDAEIEIACDEVGTILGMRGRMFASVGAYARGTGGVAPARSAQFLPGPYRVANVGCEVNAFVTNKTPTGTYRGPGRVAANFFRERMIDIAAADLGLDPIEMRRRNLVTAAEMPYGIGQLVTFEPAAQYDTGDFHIPFHRAIEEIKWHERSALTGRNVDGWYHGLGMCCFVESSAGGLKENSRFILGADGVIDVHVGTNSWGQGHETSLAQIAGDAMGLPLDAVRIHHGSTMVLEEGFGTFHSRTTVMAGSAILEAAGNFRKEAERWAALLLGLPNEELEWSNGRYRTAGGACVGLAELAAFAAGQDKKILASGTFNHTKGKPYSYGAHAAYVAVDPATGRVRVLDYIAIEDLGRIINPMIVHGQTIGGIVQGLGGAFLEHLIYDEQGQLLTASLADYFMPLATDFPNIRGICLEDGPALGNPLGAKGAGEGGVVGVSAAIGNAVSAALSGFGVQVRAMPLTPPRIWELVNGSGKTPDRNGR